jgi:two-component system phosphate regulon sensor histidine kinase PhoR
MLEEKVFVVISEPQLGDFLVKESLSPAGFEVTLIQERGLVDAMLRQSLPDAIIIGEYFNGQDGIAFAATLIQDYPALPLILIANSGCGSVAERAIRAGVSDCISLPLRPEQVIEAVRRCIDHGARLREWVQRETRRGTSILQRRLDVLETLGNVGRSVTASLDLDYVLTAVVDAAVSMTGAEEGSLLLLDEDTGELYMRASRNFQDEFVRTFRLPIEDTLAGEVIQTGRPVILDQGAPQKIKTSYLVRNLIYVPLEVHGRVIGALGVDKRISKEPFSEHHLTLVSALSDYAAIAIENARLYYNTEIERKKLETILTRIGDGVIVVGADKRIMLVNRPARDAFNLGEKSIISYKIEEVFNHEQLLELLSDDHKKYPFRSELILDDGRVLNAQLVSIPDVGLAVTMQDITHLKELDRIKSEFVNTVSHDLRSPLTAILGYVELLERAGTVSAQQREFISRIQVSVRNITTLINDLLDLGRIESGFDTRNDVVPISAIVQYSVDSLKELLVENNQELKVEIPPDLPMVFGNPVRLRQMVDNLLLNASRYTPPGGHIRLLAYAEEEQVIVQITDTGPGIPVIDQPYIFDKFYRASNVPPDISGSGLGLTIVKSIVKNHHGRIWVDSTLGKGSTFTVVLPRVKVENEPYLKNS